MENQGKEYIDLRKEHPEGNGAPPSLPPRATPPRKKNTVNTVLVVLLAISLFGNLAFMMGFRVLGTQHSTILTRTSSAARSSLAQDTYTSTVIAAVEFDDGGYFLYGNGDWDDEDYIYEYGSFTVEELIQLAPHVSTATFDEIIYRLTNSGRLDVYDILDLAHLMSSDGIENAMSFLVYQNGIDADDIIELASYMQTETIDQIMLILADTGQLSVDKLTRAAGYMSTNGIETVTYHLMDIQGLTVQDLTKLAPYISSGIVDELALRLIQN